MKRGRGSPVRVFAVSVATRHALGFPMARRILLPLLTLFIACAPQKGAGGDAGFFDDIDAAVFGVDAPLGPRADASLPPDADNTTAYPDAQTFPDGGGACGQDWECPTPVDDNCDIGGPDTCGDGTDNNCNGEVDEGCACQGGAVQSCFLGPPGRRNVGACVDGMQTCVGSGEFTYWGPCEGGIRPGAETCDSLDNSCNGCQDDHPECCDVVLNCPGPGDLPDGAPFQDYVINGANFYAGAVTSWAWTVVGGPCDQLLDATSGKTSYTLSGETTSQLTLRPTLSGDYTVTVTIVTAEGETLTCTFIVHIAGPGLRFELCWDTTGAADIDLHVHKEDSTTPWFTTKPNNNTVNPDDCYYANCKGSIYANPLPPPFGPVKAEWGYANSPLAECTGGPEGADWNVVGSCHNPRLDIDNVSEAGRPENMNIDVPKNAKTYRAMVHYWGGTVVTKPMVNVYCGGTLKATYGAAPDTVPGFLSGGGFGEGVMWRVAVVTPAVSGGITNDCSLTPLNPPGMASGFWVTTDDRSY